MQILVPIHHIYSETDIACCYITPDMLLYLSTGGGVKGLFAHGHVPGVATAEVATASPAASSVMLMMMDVPSSLLPCQCGR